MLKSKVIMVVVEYHYHNTNLVNQDKLIQKLAKSIFFTDLSCASIYAYSQCDAGFIQILSKYKINSMQEYTYPQQLNSMRRER